MHLAKVLTRSLNKLFDNSSFKGFVAKRIWQPFAAVAGVTRSFLQLRYTLKKWWTTSCNDKLKPLYKVVPALVWKICKRRNIIMHGGYMSITKVLFE
ncbi:hypothetical protein HAX54_038498, partial [Datura stramonium]|nr:hypothetical protein [Datura stramonium]